MSFWSAVWRVWSRYFLSYRRNLWFAVTTTYVEPILYLLSFGFGLGEMVGDRQIQGVTVSYRQFVFAGIAAQTILFQGFFEGAYGGFVRMYYQKVFQAIAVTPITLEEILWGEMFWNASKATFAVSAVFLIGAVTGLFSWLGVLIIMPLAFLFALEFASLGLLTAARSRTIDEISYPQFLLVFPMFLFCGVFFPIDVLPPVVRGLVWVLPLTPVCDVIRGLTLGTPMWGWSPFLIILWTGFLVPMARKAMFQRLVK